MPDLKNMCDYMVLVERLTKVAKFRAHAGGGHPGRGPESAVLREAVPPEGGERNVYFYGHDVVLVYGYNKSKASRSIVRVPDYFTSAVLKFLMLVAKPIYWALHAVLTEAGIFEAVSEQQRRENRSFLYVLGGERIDGPTYNKAIESGFERFVGYPLTTLNWRHLDSALTRHFLEPREVALLEDNPIVDEESKAHARQFGHNVLTNRQSYGREGGRVARKDYEDYVSISRKRCAVIFHLVDPLYTAQAAAGGEAPPVQAAAAPVPGAALVRAPPPSQPAPPPALVQASLPGPEVLPTASTLVPPPLAPLSIPESVGARCVLARALRNGQLPIFRDKVLQQAVHYATTTQQSMLVITATGSGKGAVILALGAYNTTKGRWTIVTVPLTALKDDLLRRAKDVGIRAYDWNQMSDSRAWDMGAGLIFITPEGCTDGKFSAFLQEKYHMSSLGHVIHDEAHYRITWAKFR